MRQAVARSEQFPLGIEHGEEVAGSCAEASAGDVGGLARRLRRAEQAFGLPLRAREGGQRPFGFFLCAKYGFFVADDGGFTAGGRGGDLCTVAAEVEQGPQ